MKKIWILVVMSFVLFGCTTAEEKPKLKAEYSIGETAQANGMRFTVLGQRNLKGSEFFKPEAETEWLAVEIVFENISDESIYVNSMFEISIKDSEGIVKEQNYFTDAVGNLSGDVLPGEKLRGEVAFVVTGKEENLFLYYTETWNSDNTIKVKLK